MAKRKERKQQKVALVHDFLQVPGGAEKVLRVLADMYPDAPIYTLLYDEKRMRGMFADRTVHTSFLQHYPRWMRRNAKWLLPFLPVAPETFDLRDYDLVISSSGAWSKGIVTRVTTKHVAYIHSPMRFVWDENIRYARQRSGKEPGFFARILLSYLRVWDHEAAARPDCMVANSHYTAQRIKKFYRRDVPVVYPSVAVSDENIVPVKDRTHFLVVSRLSEYKQVALAVEVCTKLKLPLVVVGAGRQLQSLRDRAGDTVQIVGYVSDKKLTQYYRSARALLFGAEEDFGLVMVESLAHGTPVIAYGRGGSREIVTAGETGELFFAQTPEVLADGMRRFLEKEGQYDVAAMQHTVAQFSQEKFVAEMRTVIDECMAS
jgi:glycosyltransferase involved in cell wall biosynthesis